MKTLALASAVVLGSLLAAAPADAGGYGYGYGFAGGGYGYNSYYGGHLHHNVNPYTATYGGGHLHWHDTSHYDYVPSRVVRHGFHYHVQPGGYYFHRDGHFDLHH